MRSNLRPKDFAIAIVFFVVFAVVFFLCTEYLPNNFSYGWIAAAVFGVGLVVWMFAINGFVAGIIGLVVVLLLILLGSI